MQFAEELMETIKSDDRRKKVSQTQAKLKVILVKYNFRLSYTDGKLETIRSKCMRIEFERSSMASLHVHTHEPHMCKNV